MTPTPQPHAVCAHCGATYEDHLLRPRRHIFETPPPGECLGCDPSGALCPGHPAAPPPPPVEGPGLAQAERVELWDAINRYTVACRGDPSRYHSVARMTAVADVEAVVRRALDAEEALAKARRKAAEAILADREIVFGTKEIQAAVMRWARAELGSAP